MQDQSVTFLFKWAKRHLCMLMYTVHCTTYTFRVNVFLTQNPWPIKYKLKWLSKIHFPISREGHYLNNSWHPRCCFYRCLPYLLLDPLLLSVSREPRKKRPKHARIAPPCRLNWPCVSDLQSIYKAESWQRAVTLDDSQTPIPVLHNTSVVVWNLYCALVIIVRLN